MHKFFNTHSLQNISHDFDCRKKVHNLILVFADLHLSIILATDQLNGQILFL